MASEQGVWDGSDEPVFPKLGAPLPIYIEVDALRAAKPNAPIQEVVAMIAGDVFFAGSCLKFVGIHIGDIPELAAGAVVLNASVAAAMRVNIPAVGMASVPLTEFYSTPLGAPEAPQLGALCDERINDVLTETNVTFTLPGVGSSAPFPVIRVLPDVDPNDELPPVPPAPGIVVDADAPQEGPRQYRIGLCSLFMVDGAAGSGWRAYWSALGVSRFFMYFNGQFAKLEEGETKQLRELASHPNVTLVEWPFPYALRFNSNASATENATVWAARSAATTHCAHAFGSSVDILLVADSKDFLVLPRHASLHGLLAELEEDYSARAATAAQQLTSDGGSAAASATALLSGGPPPFGFHTLNIPGYWGASFPTPARRVALEMGISADMADRIRGDLTNLKFFGAGRVLRHPSPNGTVARYGVARAAVPRMGVLCSRSPCRHTSAGPPRVELNVSAADAYVRIANLASPIAWNASQLADVVGEASVVDAGFRRHLDDALALSLELKKPSESVPALHGTAAAAASRSKIVAAAPSATVAPSLLPPPVEKLHAELAARQLLLPNNANVDCRAPGRRFLVFEYGAEQAVNGFAAIFQFYAGALALAYSSNRTLVELLPRPPSAANDEGSEGGLFYPSREAILVAGHTGDGWHRAPAASCHGAKMGCFFARHAGCAVTGVAGGVLPLLNFTAELLMAGKPLGPSLSASAGITGRPRQSKKGRNAAEAPLVRIDTLEGYRAEISAATRGDYAPAWFRSEAAVWACGRCAALSPPPPPKLNLRDPAGMAAAAVSRALSDLDTADHCSTYCSGGPERAWRRMWFPAMEAFLFAPKPALASASAEALGAVMNPPDAGDVIPGWPHANNSRACGGVTRGRRVGMHGFGANTYAVPPVGDTAAAAHCNGDAAEVRADGSAAITTTCAPAASALGDNDAIASSYASAAGAYNSGRPHIAVGLHFRTGDTAALVWRAHAPLARYAIIAQGLLRSVSLRAARAASSALTALDEAIFAAKKPLSQYASAQAAAAAASDASSASALLALWAASPLAPAVPPSVRNVSVHASLVFSTDSAAARKSLFPILFDPFVYADTPLIGGPHNRSIVVGLQPTPTPAAPYPGDDAAAAAPPAAGSNSDEEEDDDEEEEAFPSPTPSPRGYKPTPKSNKSKRSSSASSADTDDDSDGSIGLEGWVPSIPTAVIHAADPSADPLIAGLDPSAHRMIEDDPIATGNVINVLRGHTMERVSSYAWDRVVLSGAPVLTVTASATPSASPSANTTITAAAAKTAQKKQAAAAAAAASSSSSASSTPTPLPTPHDGMVHMESWISNRLSSPPALKPWLGIRAGPSDEETARRKAAGAFAVGSKESDAVFISIADGDYEELPRALSLDAVEGIAPSPFEEADLETAEYVSSLTSGVVTDIWLLSHANYMVGTCLSQVSRLAYELQYASGRARSHPVGLDAAMCRAFPMPAPYSLMADWRETFDVWLAED